MGYIIIVTIEIDYYQQNNVIWKEQTWASKVEIDYR